MARNIFSLPSSLSPDGGEIFENLLHVLGDARVERIVSHGHTTPEGEWYDQEEDEWVIVLEGKARLVFADNGGTGADGGEAELERGDYIFLPRRVKHRVSYTSSPCVWLAVFGDLKPE